MWTRAEMKDQAKEVLRKTYWKALLAALLAFVLSVSPSTAFDVNKFCKYFHCSDFISAPWFWPLCGFLSLFSAFVGSVIQVGEKHYFLRNHSGEAQISDLFFGFRDRYLHIVGAQFTTDLIITLWALLLIIPGIVVGYKYSMVPYILSEHPELSGAQARALSAKMTDNQKRNLFGLDLSFFGWALAGILCLGIGIFFVFPYFQQTKVELYLFLRDRIGAASGEPEKEGNSRDSSVEA
jgi:uncharacterized membrane protein